MCLLLCMSFARNMWSPGFLGNWINLGVSFLTRRFSSTAYKCSPCSSSEPSPHFNHGLLSDTHAPLCTTPLSKTILTTLFQFLPSPAVVLGLLSACLLVFGFGGAAVISGLRFHENSVINLLHGEQCPHPATAFRSQPTRSNIMASGWSCTPELPDNLWLA